MGSTIHLLCKIKPFVFFLTLKQYTIKTIVHVRKSQQRVLFFQRINYAFYLRQQFKRGLLLPLGILFYN